MPTIPTKAGKVIVPVLASDFPWDIIPPMGTPGSKTLTLTLDFDYGTGTVTAPLKVHGLQRIFVAQQEAPGGYHVIRGKLAANGSRLLEAGALYQPPPPPKPAAE